eukprot:6396526-Karenia_brevis.AAC.1
MPHQISNLSTWRLVLVLNAERDAPNNQKDKARILTEATSDTGKKENHILSAVLNYQHFSCAT